MPKISITDD